MIAINKLASALFSGGIKGHFGQWAEDVLIRKFFDKSKKNGVYLDIGSYHPFAHSNTAYFWMKGWHGFNVDANPHTIKIFNKYRPSDTNIWAAIVPAADYDNGTRQVSLMLPTKADHSSGVAATGTVNSSVGNERGFSETLKVPAISVASLLKNKNIKNIDYLNVDIEGYDEIILSEIDFSMVAPTVVTVEDYSDDFEILVRSGITNLMRKNGYSLAGRAGPTSIFLKRS
jgi:FkbM family methyltransferase